MSTHPIVRNSLSKDRVILDGPRLWRGKDLSLWERLAAYQLVGGVTAHQGDDV